MNQYRNNFLCLLFLSVVLILPAGAETTGTLSGTVFNSAAAPMPGAAVTVTPVAGGASQRVLTSSDGTFTIVGLPPGTYRVDVEAGGYKRSSIQNVEMAAGSPAQIKIDLQQGDTRETVEVQGSAVLIQPDNAEVAKALDIRTLTTLPLYDRNHQELVQLLPGVTPPQTTDSVLVDPQRNRIWETNGLPNTANHRTLDGLENEEPFQGASVYVSPLESIHQVDLATSNYNARLGRGAGTILNPVTRTGTNDLHGSLFELHSNSAMSARNYFDPKGAPQAGFRMNQFGLQLGGPIRRDSTFFLLSYEGDMDRRQIATLTTVPTADFRTGNFSGVTGLTLFNPATGTSAGANRLAFPGATIPASQISPIARSINGLLPLPNQPGFENNLLANVPLRNDGHRGDIRLDHKAGEGTNLFLRWSYANYNDEQASPLGVLGGGVGHLQNHNAMIGGTHTFSPALIADLRFGYTRWANKLSSGLDPSITAAGLGFTDPSASQFAGSPGVPLINVAGMQAIGTPTGFPQLNIDNTLNLANGWNWMTGRHNVHLGFDVWGIRNDGFQNWAYGPTGGFFFGPGATASRAGTSTEAFANSYAAFLLGAPTQSGRNLPTLNPSYTQMQGSVWLADSWKVTSKLALDIGARWDVFSPVAPRRNEGVSIYNPATNQLVPTNTGGISNTGILSTNWKNVAPRFGFAYRPMDRTVVRGGYAITFFNGPLNFYEAAYLSDQAVGTGVASGFGTVAGPGSGAGAFGTLPVVNPVSGATGALTAPNSTAYFIRDNLRTPYVQQFNFLLEQDVGRYGLVGTIGYVGNLGRELLYSRDINAALPGTGVAGLPLNVVPFNRTASTVELASGLTSNYNSLQATLTKRFGQGLSFTMAYTYSKALDYGSGGLNLLQNNLDIRSNYGPADWDRTHMFTLSHVWRLPFGAESSFLNEGAIGRILGPWQLDGVFRWVSGTPFTLTADPTLCNCPGNTPRADTVVTGIGTGFVPFPTFFGFIPVPVPTLNFGIQQPATGTFGNLGRNSFRGDGFANYDLSLFRTFVVHEQTKLEFRAEAYNIANTPHFANPVSSMNSASFGQSLRTLPYAPERRLQLGARILW